MAKKERVDLLLVDQGLVESRSQAQRLIMAGQVRAAGELVHKASQQFEPGVHLTVTSRPRFVSRGGEKLEAALKSFQLTVEGVICADVGSSTGGFTDCLLQHGAERIYAIDVGKGQLHWSLRGDPRVIVMEGVNARYLDALPEPVRIVTVDAAFISLRLLLPKVAGWLEPGGEAVALVKPQFEAGIVDVGKGGIVKDQAVHKRVLEDVICSARELRLGPEGLIRSPIRGAKGNLEFLLRLRLDSGGLRDEQLIDALFPAG